MDFDEIFRECPKWDKEQVICGIDLDHCLNHLDPGFFKGSYSQMILGLILMIVQELSSLGGGLRSLSALVIFCGFIFTCNLGAYCSFVTDVHLP